MKAVKKQNKYSKRYIYIPASTSAHCCFECTVVDTTIPVVFSDGHYLRRDGYYDFEPVCECFDEENAILICDALNKIEGIKG